MITSHYQGVLITNNETSVAAPTICEYKIKCSHKRIKPIISQEFSILHLVVKKRKNLSEILLYAV